MIRRPPSSRHPGAVALAALPLAALMAWAPWPFGSVAPRAASAVVAGAALSLFVAAITVVVVPAAARGVDRLRAPGWGAAALLAVAFLGVIQAMPWPRDLLAAVSPEHLRLAQEAREALAGADGAQAAASGVPVRATLAPSATARAALLFAGFAAALAAAAFAGRSRRARRLLGASLVATALVQALVGARSWVAGEATVLGIEVAGSASRLRGTFVNPNHLATFLAMALAVTFAWGVWAAGRGLERGIDTERRLLLLGPPVVVWMALFTALAFTGSRAGLAAVAVGTALQGMLATRVVRRRAWRRPAWIGSGALLVVAGAAAAWSVGRGAGLERITGTTVAQLGWDARLEAVRRSLELWGRFPWTGSGLGTFREAFPLVQPVDLPGDWWHAHSDPVELLVTAGVVGALPVALGLGVLVRRHLVVLRDGARSEDRAAGLAAVGATAAVGFQELVEFGLVMPANALALAVVVGAAAAAARRARGAGRSTVPDRDG